MVIAGTTINLRSPNKSDASLFLKWTDNPNNIRYSLWEFQVSKTKEDFEEYLSKSGLTKGKISFMIYDRKTKKTIGETGLNNIDLINRRARTFTLIGDISARGSGKGKEAKRLVVDYAFKVLNLHRVYCSVTTENQAWIDSLLSLGFKIEGRERESSFRDGIYYDKLLLGLTQEEWTLRNKQTQRAKYSEKEYFAKVLNPQEVFKNAKEYFIFNEIEMKIYTFFPFNTKDAYLRVKSEKQGNSEKYFLDFKRKYKETKNGTQYTRTSKEISLTISSFADALEMVKELNFRLDKFLYKTRYQFYINNCLVSLDSYSQPDKDWWIEIEDASVTEITQILNELHAKCK